MTLDDIARVEHTRLRRDLLYGRGRKHFKDRIRLNIGNVREEAWGEPDQSAVALLDLATEASHLYDTEPVVRTDSASEALTEEVADTGYWPLMQRVQRDTWGLREMLVRVDVQGDEDDAPTDAPFAFRPVYPDMVDVTCHPRRPSIPVRVREWKPNPDLGWVLHDLDIRDLRNPQFRVYNAKNEEITRDILGGPMSGEAYRYRDANNRPILPYGVYHAAETGLFFDAWTFSGIVEGTLNLGVLLTYYQHILLNAAWAQRWMVNLEPVGLSQDDGTTGRAPKSAIVTDAATALCLQIIDPSQQPQVGQWVSPADPEAVLRSIHAYELAMVMRAGFAPPAVTRDNADVRSGYSLAVDREAARERQRVSMPLYRRGDQEIFRIAACLSNRFRGTRYSEIATDYRPSYTSLPKSPAERRVEADELKAKQDAGLIGPVTALRTAEPGLTEEEAIQKLADRATEIARVEAATKAALRAIGVTETPPPAVLSTGDKAEIRETIRQAQAAEIPIASARAHLVSVVGLPVTTADALLAAVVPTPPPKPTPTIPAPGVAPEAA